MQVASVAAIIPASLLILPETVLIITASCPDPSIMPPNIIAIIVIRIELDIFISPPVVRRLLIASTSVLQKKPLSRNKHTECDARDSRNLQSNSEDDHKRRQEQDRTDMECILDSLHDYSRLGCVNISA